MKFLYLGCALTWFFVAGNILAEDMKNPLNIAVSIFCALTAALLWVVVF